eukprot:GHVN01096018.1.p1 GENE.GHVN01096018.1~~GHVN01096018.1.p1  ORF type:complete len:1157 (-),score=129.21 GHVN01096018.1:539-4009(-)
MIDLVARHSAEPRQSSYTPEGAGFPGAVFDECDGFGAPSLITRSETSYRHSPFFCSDCSSPFQSPEILDTSDDECNTIELSGHDGRKMRQGARRRTVTGNITSATTAPVGDAMSMLPLRRIFTGGVSGGPLVSLGEWKKPRAKRGFSRTYTRTYTKVFTTQSTPIPVILEEDEQDESPGLPKDGSKFKQLSNSRGSLQAIESTDSMYSSTDSSYSSSLISSDSSDSNDSSDYSTDSDSDSDDSRSEASDIPRIELPIQTTRLGRSETRSAIGSANIRLNRSQEPPELGTSHVDPRQAAADEIIRRRVQSSTPIPENPNQPSSRHQPISPPQSPQDTSPTKSPNRPSLSLVFPAWKSPPPLVISTNPASPPVGPALLGSGMQPIQVTLSTPPPSIFANPLPTLPPFVTSSNPTPVPSADDSETHRSLPLKTESATDSPAKTRRSTLRSASRWTLDPDSFNAAQQTALQKPKASTLDVNSLSQPYRPRARSVCSERLSVLLQVSAGPCVDTPEKKNSPRAASLRPKTKGTPPSASFDQGDEDEYCTYCDESLYMKAKCLHPFWPDLKMCEMCSMTVPRCFSCERKAVPHRSRRGQLFEPLKFGSSEKSQVCGCCASVGLVSTASQVDQAKLVSLTFFRDVLGLEFDAKMLAYQFKSKSKADPFTAKYAYSPPTPCRRKFHRSITQARESLHAVAISAFNIWPTSSLDITLPRRERASSSQRRTRGDASASSQLPNPILPLSSPPSLLLSASLTTPGEPLAQNPARQTLHPFGGRIPPPTSVLTVNLPIPTSTRTLNSPHELLLELPSPRRRVPHAPPRALDTLDFSDAGTLHKLRAMGTLPILFNTAVNETPERRHCASLSGRPTQGSRCNPLTLKPTSVMSQLMTHAGTSPNARRAGPKKQPTNMFRSSPTRDNMTNAELASVYGSPEAVSSPLTPDPLAVDGCTPPGKLKGGDDDLLRVANSIHVFTAELQRLNDDFSVQSKFGQCDMRKLQKRSLEMRVVDQIYVVKGLPTVLFTANLCHELLHAYLFLAGYPEMTADVEEGLCNAVAVMYLNHRMEVIEERLSRAQIAQEIVNSEGNGAAPVSVLTDLLTPSEAEILLQELDVCDFTVRKFYRNEHPHYGEGFRRAIRSINLNGVLPSLRQLQVSSHLPCVACS